MQRIIYDLRNLPDRPKDFLSSDEDLTYLAKKIDELSAEGKAPFFVPAPSEFSSVDQRLMLAQGVG